MFQHLDSKITFYHFILSADNRGISNIKTSLLYIWVELFKLLISMAIEIEFFSLVSETIFSRLVLRLSSPLKIVSLHQWTLFKVVNESEFLKKLVHYPILDYLVEFLNYNYLNIPRKKNLSTLSLFWVVQFVVTYQHFFCWNKIKRFKNHEITNLKIVWFLDIFVLQK